MAEYCDAIASLYHTTFPEPPQPDLEKLINAMNRQYSGYPPLDHLFSV